MPVTKRKNTHSFLQAAKEILLGLVATARYDVGFPVLAEAGDLLNELEAGAIKGGAVIPLIISRKIIAETPGKESRDTSTSNGHHGKAVDQHVDAMTVEAMPPPAPTKKQHVLPQEESLIDSEDPIQPMHRLVALSDPGAAIGVAVGLVNSGKCGEAVALLDLIQKHHGTNAAVHAARGTAKALLGELDDAVMEFDSAISLEPKVCDFYKRRSQALAACDRDMEALADLQQARQLAPDSATASEILADSARINQKRKDFRRAEEDLKTAFEIMPTGMTSDLLLLMGSCQVSQGDLE